MAKKKTIDLRSVDPTPVPAGDVNIIYNGTRIGGFSEDTEAVLKTAGCRVEQDINVNYTKPTGRPAGNVVNITNNSSGTPSIVGSGLMTAEGVIKGPIPIPSGNSTLFLYNDFDENAYITYFDIFSETDAYSVTVNNTPISYQAGNDGYSFERYSETGPITGQTYNVVITDKE